MPRRVPPFRYVLVSLGLVLAGAVALSVFRDARGGPYDEAAWGALAGDAERGKLALEIHSCGACHVIPGIRNANGRVGPKLEDLHEQVYIGGVVANSPDNLAAWIRNPQAFSPQTAMPNLNITERDAEDMAAYLLREQAQ